MSFGGGDSGSGTISGAGDVSLSSPATDQVLTFNAVSQKWENQLPAVTAAGGTISGDLSVGGAVTASGDFTAPGVRLWYIQPGDAGDVTPIQTLFDQIAADGGNAVVRFRPGVYDWNGTVYLRTSGVVLDARGCTFTQTGATRFLGNYDNNNTVTDYGGNSNIWVLGGIWDRNNTDGGNGMTFAHAKNIHVSGITVRNVVSTHALEFDAVDGFWVENCTFEGFRDGTTDGSRSHSEAIQISDAVSPQNGNPDLNGWIKNCICRPSDTQGSYGHLVGSHAVIDQAYPNIVVDGNVAINPLYGLVHMTGWTKSKIINNYCTGAGQYGCWIQLGSTQTEDSVDLLIANNEFVGGTNTNTANGVIHIALVAGATAIVRDIRIIDNIIDGNAGNGITLASTQYARIEDNTIRNVKCALSCSATCALVTVRGNLFENITAANGVYCNTPDVLLQNNTFLNAGTTTSVAMSSASRCRVLGNIFKTLSSTATSAISVYGSVTGAGVVMGNDLLDTGKDSSFLALMAGTITAPDGTTAVPGNNLV